VSFFDLEKRKWVILFELAFSIPFLLLIFSSFSSLCIAFVSLHLPKVLLLLSLSSFIYLLFLTTISFVTPSLQCDSKPEVFINVDSLDLVVLHNFFSIATGLDPTSYNLHPFIALVFSLTPSF